MHNIKMAYQAISVAFFLSFTQCNNPLTLLSRVQVNINGNFWSRFNGVPLRVVLCFLLLFVRRIIGQG